MKTTENDATQKMATLSECHNAALKDGYVENFKVNGDELLSEDGKKHFKPNEVGIPNFFRFEGYSDPEDNSILYLMETTDGRKGTLIDSYGSDADAKISSFIRKVQDIKKQEAENPQS
jgi:hypothetical protein